MEIQYLTKEHLLLINKKTIERHGGTYFPPNNVAKIDALEYLIEAVQSDLFGSPMYPEIHEKAAVYLFN